MMKRVILIVMGLGFAMQSWGQINTKVFTLDLGEPHKESITVEDNNSKKLTIKSKELLAFKLKNGNPYKYKYVINHQLIDFFGMQGYNPMDSIGKVFMRSNNVTDDSLFNENIDTTGIEDEIKKLEEKKNVLVRNKEKGLKGTWDFEINKINDQIVSLKYRLEDFKDWSKGEYISKSVYATNFINSVKLNNLLKSVTRAIKATNEEEDKKNIENATILLHQTFEDLKIDIQKYVTKISAEDFLNHDTFDLKRQTFNSSYLKLLQAAQEIANEASNFPKVLDSFNNSIKNINPISSAIKDEITKMYQLKLHNYLLPIDINGKNIDAVEVTVERYNKSSTNPTPDKYAYNIWVKGGLKIDVSGGLFITSLMDKEYEIQGSGTNKLIYEKNKGNYDFGFGSTINISLRGGSWVRPALSVGALFTANQKFQILSGLGIILGKEQRIVLHGGLAMGTVARISDNYKADGSIAYDLGTSGTIPLVNKFSFGYFFGITYNFGKVKKADGK